MVNIHTFRAVMFVESKPFHCNNKLKYVFLLWILLSFYGLFYVRIYITYIKAQTTDLTLLRTFVNTKEILFFILHFVFVCAVYSWVLKNVNTAFGWCIARACNGAVPDTGGENIICSQIYHFAYGTEKSYTKQYIYI